MLYAFLAARLPLCAQPQDDYAELHRQWREARARMQQPNQKLEKARQNILAAERALENYIRAKRLVYEEARENTGAAKDRIQSRPFGMSVEDYRGQLRDQRLRLTKRQEELKVALNSLSTLPSDDKNTLAASRLRQELAAIGELIVKLDTAFANATEAAREADAHRQNETALLGSLNSLTQIHREQLALIKQEEEHMRQECDDARKRYGLPLTQPASAHEALTTSADSPRQWATRHGGIPAVLLKGDPTQQIELTLTYGDGKELACRAQWLEGVLNCGSLDRNFAAKIKLEHKHTQVHASWDILVTPFKVPRRGDATLEAVR